jgi:chromosome segregation ATPase
MPKFVAVAGLLLLAAAGFVLVTAEFSPGDLLKLFMSQALPQKIALGIGAATLLLLLGAAVVQSDQMVKQRKALDFLMNRLDGVRHDLNTLGQSQDKVDAAVQHMVGSDPEVAMSALQQRLAEAEQRTTAQHGRSEAVDMQTRIDETRRQQQALRERLADVVHRRRLSEPVFTELKERQNLIEEALAVFEKEENALNPEVRLKQLVDFVKKAQGRMEDAERLLVALGQIRSECDRLQERLVPLDATEAGVRSVLNQIRHLRDELSASLEKLEQDGDRKLADRVAELTGQQREYEERVARLGDYFARLEAIRKDIGGLFSRLSGALNAHVAH